MTPTARFNSSKELRVRMSKEDAKKLAWLAKQEERPGSAIVRRLIAAEYARRKEPSNV